MAILTTTSLWGGSVAAAATSSSPSPSRLVTITIPAPAGEIPSQWLNYAGPPRADVLLPMGYNPDKRYPVLFLLHGLDGNYSFFAQYGLINQFDNLGAIVVMPEGGPGGWFADWWNDGERGSPAWETYELETVIPTIMARYPILPQRQYHAIAGISMGGLGAVYLAGRLPGFFGSVASLSGFVDPQLLAPVLQPAMAFESEAKAHGDSDFDPIYGPPSGFYADGHNPTRLAMNLKQTRVFESTGTAIPNSGNLALPGLGTAGTEELVNGTWEEGIIFPMNLLYHQALIAAGVPVTYQVHSGGHDIPDFTSEISAMLAWGPFNLVTTDPTTWTNDTVATSGQLWDVGYHFAQPPNQVVQFQRSESSLSISAAGSDVTITTAGGCAIRTATPATISLSTGNCP
ncbi:MAG TPA: alpha/beta hydrolase-fold protein [Acidimicrobiales bacterium]|nr:alpha/beta hydrolase-fold protein [Acidimicrobiales bacterium]